VLLSDDKSQLADWLIEAIVSGLPDAVIVLDRNDCVVAWNEAAQKIAPALARNKPLSLALRNPDVIDAVRRAAASGRPERIEYREPVPMDQWSEVHIAPISLPESIAGRRELIILTLHDLTPMRRVEEMRADFVTNVSHELRTPLASLSGFIETLQGSARDDPEAQKRFLGIMKEQATRMARLIDDLLLLSRIEVKENIKPVQTTDLVEVVGHVVDCLQPLARGQGVAIQINLLVEQLFVSGDKDELIRVFENLIENALKYGASGKRVDVTLERSARDQAAVVVRDYGPGIAPEHLPRLTERFYRVSVSQSRGQGGTGLGLALVKHILNRHRGSLTINSTPGEGASFTVRIPLTEEASLLA
jgi:two-component system phosphate regulon sensor histidine kinase PhoR